MEYAKSALSDENILYTMASVLIFCIILSDLMILRAHLYVALLVAAAASYYLTKQARMREFFD